MRCRAARRVLAACATWPSLSARPHEAPHPAHENPHDRQPQHEAQRVGMALVRRETAAIRR
jgi:hypothetical protein